MTSAPIAAVLAGSMAMCGGFGCTLGAGQDEPNRVEATGAPAAPAEASLVDADGEAQLSTEDASVLQVTDQRIVIFKDGFALVQRHGEGRTDARSIAVAPAAPNSAVLGTVWANSSPAKLSSVELNWVTRQSDAEEEVECERVDQLLVANEGRRVRLRMNDGSTHEGTITRVLRGRARPEADTSVAELTSALASAGGPGPSEPAASEAIVRWRHPNASHVVLTTLEGQLLLSVSDIRTLTAPDLKTTLNERVIKKSAARQLVFRHDRPDTEVAVDWFYFRPGFRWIPTYQIRLDRDAEVRRASVELQAELINEGEDIRDAQVDIVVGVPHFRFRDVPSPLAIEQVLRASLENVAPQLLNYRAFSNNSIQVGDYGLRSQEFREGSAAASGALEGQQFELGDLTAEGSQDLFVYNLGKRSLSRGQRMVVPIFSTTAESRDLYTWDLNLMETPQVAAARRGGSPLELSENRVWRQVVLTNATDLPWTTGPALLMDGPRPLAQELLTYTPAKNDVRIPVTVAVDVRASVNDRELNRVPNALQVSGIGFANIQKKATLDVCNNKGTVVPLEIQLTLLGTVSNASHGGVVTQLPVTRDPSAGYDPASSVNNRSRIVWKVELQPGETFAPEVEYQHFMRH